jgi:hypothetical protein
MFGSWLLLVLEDYIASVIRWVVISASGLRPPATPVPEYHFSVAETSLSSHLMESSRKLRFSAAMAAYVLLATLAAFTLTGRMRIAVWVFLAGLAVKTWLSSLPRA